MRIYIVEAKKTGIKFINFKYRIPFYASESGQNETGVNNVTWSGYADDLTLYLATLEDLDKATSLLGSIFEEHDLNINYTKTETMILNHKNTKSRAGNLKRHIKTVYKTTTKTVLYLLQIFCQY